LINLFAFWHCQCNSQLQMLLVIHNLNRHVVQLETFLNMDLQNLKWAGTYVRRVKTKRNQVVA